MRQSQILICQFFDKIDPAHPVRQHMEYLEIDAVIIISNPEHIAAVFILNDETAGIIIFLAHLRRAFAILLKVIPEYPLAQPDIKTAEFRQDNIKRFL